MSTLLYGATNSCIVYVGGGSCPTPREWDAYVDFVRLRLVSGTPPRCLAVLEGGVADVVQRKQLADAVESYSDSRVAVLLPRVMPVLSRHAVVAFSWLVPGLKILNPDDFDGAMRYLEIDKVRAAVIHKLVDDLRSRLCRCEASPEAAR